MPKSTRLVTTVTTRNLYTPQGEDAFFLDGRHSMPRDARGGESTLDREDRGFFFALYSKSKTGNEMGGRDQKHLTKVFQEMKTAGRTNIDQEINELADCAVNISGRLTVGDSQQAPYFTGVIVKDGEFAAITSGRGCAYLYRNQILYPLTKDEYPMSDVDMYGRKVENMDLYCAGLAGTIRYSNIAQLQPDDCFVLCNKEVMETLTQQGMLKLLDESFDQQDAAARVHDEMTRRNPGATVQFMIGFVDAVTTLDKAGLKSLTGRMAWTQKSIANLNGLQDGTQSPYMPDPVSNLSADAVGSAAAGAAGIVAGMKMEDSLQQAANPVVPTTETGTLYQQQNYTGPNHEGMQPAAPGQTQTAYEALSNYPGTQGQPGMQPMGEQPFGQAAYGYENPYAQQPYSMQQFPQERQALEEEGLSTGKKVVIGLMLVIILALLVFLGYLLLNGNPFKHKPAPTQTHHATSSLPVAVRSTNKPRTTEMFPKLTRGTRPTPSVQTTQANLNTEGTEVAHTKQTVQPTRTPENTHVEPTASNSVEEPKKTEAENLSSGEGNYTVKEGDTVWGIASKKVDMDHIDAYIQKIVEANPDKQNESGDNLILHEGDVLVIPAP